MAVAGAVLFLVIIAIGDRLTHRDRVLGGIEVAGISLGNDTESEALHTITDLGARLNALPIHAHAGTADLTLAPADIGYHLDGAATVRKARVEGRSANPMNALSGTILRRLRPDRVHLVVRYDRSRLAAVIDSWAGATGKGLVDGGLRFDNGQVAEIRPRRGVGIDRSEAERRVIDAMRAGSTEVGQLRIGPTAPAITLAQVNEAARRVRRLLSAPVVITSGATQITLTPQQVATTLRTQIHGRRLEVSVDNVALRAAIGPQLVAIETAPKDATFAVNGTTVSVVPAAEGQTVSIAALGRAIANGNHAIVARTAVTPPARTTEWAQRQNITELVASYTTNHPCCAPRVANIHKAADTINGTIVEAGATFSLNDALGARTAEKGYVLAPGIGANLEFEDSVGGGVSQLSTTLYNATFFGCYQDVTHTVHALYISRYPMGREATLNYPSIDNKFRNDSHSGILIRTSYSDTSVTVSFYGNKEGRSCRAEGPTILQTIPITDEFVDDPALPTGTLQQLAHGSEGYVVENFRIISRPGLPELRERYAESYSMAKNKVARGTGPAAPVPPPVAGAAPPALPAPATPPAS